MGRERNRRARRHQDVDVERKEFVNERRYALRVAFGVALIEQEVAPQDISTSTSPWRKPALLTSVPRSLIQT